MKSGFDSIAYWLIDYYIAATVVLAVVLLAQRLIRQPARRLALHWGGLVGLALLAFLCVLPGWPRIDLLNVAREMPDAVFQPAQQSTTNHSVPVKSADAQEPSTASIAETHHQPSRDMAEQRLSGGPRSGDDTADASHAAVVRLAADRPVPAGSEGFLNRLVNLDLGPARLLILAIFAMGCTLTAFRVIHGVLAARRVRLSASEAPRNVVAELERLVGGERCPELLVSRSHPIPIVTGTLWPKILLPPQFAEKERPDDCRSVLAHELAHIRNGDLWLLALDRWLLPLFWLHPLYLRLRRSIRDDQELLADAFAASHSTRADYAEMLVRWARRLLAEKQSRQLTSAVGVWDRPTRLADRISRLLHQTQRMELDCPRHWRVGSLLSLIALPILLSTATVRPDASPSFDLFADLLSLAKTPDQHSCCQLTRQVISDNPEERLNYSMERPAIADVRRLGGWVKSEQFGLMSFVTEVNLVFHYTEEGYRFENKSFTSEVLADVAKFHHLKRLTLASGQITADGLRRLSALRELEALVLWDARSLSDAGLAELVKLPRLRHLELTNAPIGDRAFARLALLKNLEELSVEGSPLSEAAIGVSARLPRLRRLSLDLPNCTIERDALLGLRQLPNLRSLSLHCAGISDEALNGIRSLTGLRLLAVGDSRVSSAALGSLRRSLPDLTVQTSQQTLRPLSADSGKDFSDDTGRAAEIVATIRQFTRLVARPQSRAAQLMSERPEVAQIRIAALRIYPALKNVDWKLAYAGSNAALAVSSEFSSRCGGDLVFTCRLRRLGNEWKIDELVATSVRGGVDQIVVQFASANPKVRATDAWLASPANVR